MAEISGGKENEERELMIAVSYSVYGELIQVLYSPGKKIAKLISGISRSQ